MFEENSPVFTLEGIWFAQEKSWGALKKIRDQLSPGINEIEAIRLASALLEELGSEKSWHRPIVRFGENTWNTYSVPPDAKRVLRPDDIYSIDLGPVWRAPDGLEYEGDVGETFCLSEDPEPRACASAARELFHAASDLWRTTGCTGVEIYEYLKKESARRGYQLVLEGDGHRIGDFPHKRFYQGALSSLDFSPKANLWILEVQLRHRDQKFGAFFEDLLR